MTILTKAIEFVKRYEVDIILATGVVLVSLFSFAMGYLSAKEQFKEPLQLEQVQQKETDMLY